MGARRSILVMHDIKQFIKKKANSLGFFYCGFSKATFLEEEAKQLETWLNKKYHGKMSYMENYFDKRLDPRLLVDGAKTVISLLLNYFPKEKQTLSDEGIPKISSYAYGEDYHTVIKDKLKTLMSEIKDGFGEINGKAFVDSAPVMDKAWAKRSGLGWIGKNSNLIHPKEGSFFFIAELIVDIDIPPDGPLKDYCGTCTRCIDACPTEAIVSPYIVQGDKCISYLTIELKDELIPGEFKNKMENWAFGCDICQDVCPWNSFSKPTVEQRFQANKKVLNLTSSEWEQLSEEMFHELFKKSAVKRTKFSGLKRNIQFIKTR